MPPQSRSQRRRQNERQQHQQQQPKQRPALQEVVVAHTTETMPLHGDDDAGYGDLALPHAEASESAVVAPVMPAAVAAPVMPAAKRPAVTSTRGSRRARTRSAPEPVDYTKDYQAARRDLRWIAFWAVLLFAAMIVLRVTGIV